MRCTRKKLASINMLQLSQRAGDLKCELVIDNEIVLNPEEAGNYSQGVLNPVLAGCAHNMAVQIDDPISYVNINIVIVDRS
jgi:hypothetical protein